MKKLLGTLSAIAALMTAIAFIGCKQPSNEEDTITLTLNFDGFSIPGGSVSVYYGAGDGDYETVAADVNSAGTSASAELRTSLANDYGWFNGIKITVKNADEEEIAVSYTDNFKYAETSSLTLTKKVASEMTVKLVFADFTAEKVVVKYGPSDNATDSDIVPAEVKLADTKDSATITISNAKITGWVKLYDLDFYANESDEDPIAITFVSSSDGSTGPWFEFAAGADITITYKKAVSGDVLVQKKDFVFSEEGESVLPANDVPKGIKTLIIKAANVQQGDSSGDWWAGTTVNGEYINFKDHWNDTIKGYLVEISDSDSLSALASDGLWIKGLEGLVCDLTIEYL